MRIIGLGAIVVALASGLHAGATRADGPPPVYQPPGAYQPVTGSMFNYNWSGIYVGGHAGGVYIRPEWSYVNSLNSIDESTSSFAGGAQVGLQKQWGSMVLGAEVSYTWWDGEGITGTSLVPNVSLTSDVGNVLLATGKFGIVYENLLAYVKGGYASADVDLRTTVTSTGALLTSSTGREGGWTAGVGIDYAILPNVILGFEYDYIKLNVSGRNQTPTALGPVGTSVIDAGVDAQMLTARLNFKFGPGGGPPVPPQ
jgi:outer membrane immunogenic protein